jgi:hypothetical protein
MAIQSDSFQILSNCRALFLRHLGALLQDSRLVSGNAIRAIQEGAGAYFDEMVSTSRRGGFAEEAHGLTSSRITLVGEDDMELGIRLDNLSAKLFEATGGGLWKIHLRFVSLLRRPDLPKSDNPVGPKGISQGLQAMFTASGASSIEQKLALLDRIEGCLAQNLPALYAEINDFLDRGGVETAQPSIVSTQENPPAGRRPQNTENALLALQQSLLTRLPVAPPAAATMPEAADGSGAAASLLSQATLERLLFRLNELDRQGTFRQDFRPGTTPSNESLIPELFAADAIGNAAPKILKSAQLGIPATAGEGLAIDTLAMIFEAIFNDPTLPDALKATISSLQITLLKVAMRDATLFTDSRHPARQVIDRMGQAVLGLPADVPARHPVCAGLFEVAGQLRGEQNISNAAFTDALAKLDALIARRNEDLSAAVEPYLPLLRQVDRGDEAGIAARNAVDRVIERNPPLTIRNFLNASWCKVLQQVWLDHGPESSQWEAHVSAIDDLLWTFQPKTDPEERKTLARRLPVILKLLKTGMEQVGLPAQAQDAFLDDCFTLQTQALRATPNSADDGTLPALAPVGLHKKEGTPITGRVQIGELTMTTLDLPDFQSSPAPALPAAIGDWLELQIDAGKPLSARLSYISPGTRRAMLLNPDLGLALAIHPAILDRRLRSGEARNLTAASLFDDAASRALRNSATS